MPSCPREVRSARMKAYYAANPRRPESDETKLRKAEAAKAYWNGRRKAHADGKIEVVAHKAHKNSEQTKRKLAEAAKRQWLTRDRSVSADTRQKLSAASLAHWQGPAADAHREVMRCVAADEGWRAKISESLKAALATLSPEDMRARMSKAQRMRWANHKAPQTPLKGDQ